MKKILMMAVVAFGMLATACSKDEVAQPVVGGEESVVTFTVEAPVMATRAHGDGTTATQLSWAVYDENDTLLFQSSEVTVMSGLKATVEIPFVNGMEYNILFWAEAEQSPYSVEWANLKVGYKNQTLVSNSENYDAFYCYFTELGEVTGPVTKTVELKRPFAQLNIATNDTAEAAQSGLVVENVAVEVTNAYTQFDLVTGNGVNASNTGVTFTSAPKQGGTILSSYDLLAVNYLFTGGEKQLVNVKFSYTDSDTKGGNAGRTAEYNSVPVQRNYRTNIVGSLLTSDGKFNIEIKPGFETTEHKYEVVSVSTAQELQNAVNSGAGEIILEDDIVLNGPIVFGTSTRAEVAETNVRPFILDGNGQTLTYNGSDRAINVLTADINLTIKNLTIDCTASYCNRGINYATNGNLTLENVTITGENTTYALNLPDPSDNATVVINNSKITGVIALNVWGENVKMDVTNSEITSVDKADHENYAAIKLNNNGTTSAEGSVINVEGGKVTALDENGNPSAAVTNSTKTGVINISDSTEVIGKVEKRVAMVYWEGQNEFYSCETLAEALESAVEHNADGVRLLADVETDEILVLNGSFVFDGNGKTLTYNGSDRVINVLTPDINLTIKNLTICTASYCNRGINYATNGNLTLENVIINGENITYALNLPDPSDNATIVINNSTITGVIALNVWGENVKMDVTNSEITSVDKADHENYAAIKLNNNGTTSAEGSVINVEGGKVTALDENGNPSAAVTNSTKTGVINISDSTEVIGKVEKRVAMVYWEGQNEFYSCKTLAEALESAVENNADGVRLLADVKVSEALVIPEGVTVTLDLNGKTLSGAIAKADGPILKNMGTLTVKNGTISSTAKNGGSAIQNNAGAELTINDVTINGAEFEAPGWPSYGINNYGTLTINDADITTYHGAVATGGDGVTVINDATVDVGNSTETNQTSWALYVYDNGQLTVNDGTFSNTKDEKGEVYGGGYICTSSTKETIINGGTFDKTEGDNNGSGFYYNNKNLVIKGGTFDANPSAYVATGYQVVDNGNGTWTVQ